jgi:hypothetical protein
MVQGVLTMYIKAFTGRFCFNCRHRMGIPTTASKTDLCAAFRDAVTHNAASIAEARKDETLCGKNGTMYEMVPKERPTTLEQAEFENIEDGQSEMEEFIQMKEDEDAKIRASLAKNL